MVNFTLTGLTDQGLSGTITGSNETENQEGQLEPYALLNFSDSSATIVQENGGVVRYITLKGTATFEALADLQAFVLKLDGLVNGNQSSTKTYTSDTFPSGINVKVLSKSRTYVGGNVLAIEFTLDLVEADPNS